MGQTYGSNSFAFLPKPCQTDGQEGEERGEEGGEECWIWRERERGGRTISVVMMMMMSDITHRILHPTDLILNSQFVISATRALSVKHKTKDVSSVGSWELLLTNHC